MNKYTHANKVEQQKQRIERTFIFCMCNITAVVADAAKNSLHRCPFHI